MAGTAVRLWVFRFKPGLVQIERKFPGWCKAVPNCQTPGPETKRTKHMSGGCPNAGEVGKLDRARRLYGRRAWTGAYQAFLLADQEAPLEAEDLERFAMAAYLVGRDDEYLKTLERAYNAYVNAGQGARAVRCAFWLAFRLLMRG
ncbi:MAG TPA: hypothetical protein VFV70_08025, partial [Hyphomonadaceae bacterium]|nr:hypothetical protein [Hyphomonadaceae bacterium]